MDKLDFPRVKGQMPNEHIPTLKTRAKVIEFVCAGFTQEAIAMYFDLTENTLRKHYKKELNKSKMMRTSKLARNLYLDALAGDRQSREFWLKTQGRWSFARPAEEVEKDNKALSLLEEIKANTSK